MPAVKLGLCNRNDTAYLELWIEREATKDKIWWNGQPCRCNHKTWA